MSVLNKVMMIGNLVSDPEVRQTGNGTKVADICLALNGPGRNGRGGTEDRDPPGRGGDEGDPRGGSDVTFVDVVLWERLAENASRFLGKGSPVLIEGRLHQDTWQDRKTGQNRRKLKVIAERMRFMGGPRPDGESSGARSSSSQVPAPASSR